jgi:hypothetical protein
MDELAALDRVIAAQCKQTERAMHTLRTLLRQREALTDTSQEETEHGKNGKHPADVQALVTR